ncbi:amidase [Bacillus sp. USDA818B3_A]|uniref:amidase n=1 Tax=Bacillus sp. USDA818B3_A TaxID=2698834 RepID=UPI00136B4A38|nr:amidase [Bacillus sp. USDA818B3_A]
MRDRWNAFMNEHLIMNPTGSGSLDGYTFAVKDVFAIEDYVSSAGNPDWLRTHCPAKRNAPVIDQLLAQGAYLKGMTHTDELMYSLNGENFHYGTPTNPRAEDRIPGGSSSGSAVAAAGGIVDFTLGTDTGGSVRIPSSYCGLFGIRPTHGLVNIDGVIPLAKSFDTVGWMAKNPEILVKVGEVLIGREDDSDEDFTNLYFDEEAWSFVDGDRDTKGCILNAAKILQERVSNSETIRISGNGLSNWAELFRSIQGIEIWKEHGAWIEEAKPCFGPGISERFAWSSSLNPDGLDSLNSKREEIKQNLANLLKTNGLLVIPTAPGEAPLRQLSMEDMEQYRNKTMQLTCIAGLTGFPQVTIPLLKANGIPIGLSFIANQNQDMKLLRWVQEFTRILKERNVDIAE